MRKGTGALLGVGRAITFGKMGNYATWAVQGWSQGEDQRDVTWMDGKVAALEFLMPAPATNMLLIIRMMPLALEGTVQQNLQIFFNGLFVDFWTATEPQFREYSTLLRKNFFSKDPSNLLTLVAPNALSPAQAGLGLDKRMLSFAFMQIQFQDPTREARIANNFHASLSSVCGFKQSTKCS
jgi:hypothetical protein